MNRKKYVLWSKNAVVTGLLILSFFTTASFGQVESNDIDRNGQWTIVEYFELPESSSGLAYDGEYLYSGIYGSNGDRIHRINMTTGNYNVLCYGPQDDAFGLTFDGTYLWTTDHPSDPAQALQFAFNGTLMDQFSLPDRYMSGIAYDNGDFWVSSYYPDPGTLYKVTSTGSIIDTFTLPDDQPWDLAVHDQTIWMVDYWGDMIYQLNSSTGNVIESYQSVSTEPSGIVWDGSYLWYCDNGFNGVDYLYKVDLNGSGTPEADPQSTSHNYGMVTVGTTETWNLNIMNPGTDDLIISDLQFTGTGSTYLSCQETFPLTIPAGNNDVLTIEYAPTEAGVLDATGILYTNDPLQEQIELTIQGDAVVSGPSIHIPYPHHCYGEVRVNSYNRWQLEIMNMGDSTLTVNDMNISNPVFNFHPDFSVPFSISPLQTKKVDIWFFPPETEFYSGVVRIESNDPENSIENVTVQGNAIETPLDLGSIIWNYPIYDPYDSSPKAIHHIPDINGDMKPEVIVCSEDDYIRCFNGNDHGQGDVLWEKEIYSGRLYHQQEITLIEDLDGDNIEDIIIGTPWGDRSIIALSSKTGDQIWKHDTHEYGGGGWVYQVSVHPDLNGDDIDEVLAAVGNDADDTGPNRVYLLDGTDGESLWECYLSGPGFSVISVEDFTGDGIPDVVAGASTMDETTGKIIGINGATGGVQWVKTTSGSSVWALEQLDDINNDGVKDVIAGDFFGTYYGIDPTNGNILFSASIPGNIILRFDALGDVNEDGYTDIAIAHSGSVARVIDGYTGNAVWTHSLVDKSWNVDPCGDISGDGIPDLAIGTLYSQNKVYFLDGTNGEELAVVDMESPVDALVAIPDITGDGSMEVVVGSRQGDVLCLSGGLLTSAGNTYITDLSPGWNFISAPYIQSINKTDLIVEYNDENYTWAEAVSNGYVNEFLFGWDEAAQSYQFSDALESGKGYWMYVTQSLTLYVLDCDESTEDTITSMSQDWNVIGLPFSEQIDKTSLQYIVGGTTYTWNQAVSNSLVNDFLFGWNREQQSYDFISTLSPGEAYWCYAYVAGELSK